MANADFVASVDELITHDLSIDATIRIAEVTTGKIARDGRVEEIIYRAIRGALELARKQIAARKSGTMTFEEAVQKVKEGKMVTRPEWPILQALRWWDIGSEEEHCMMLWELDNLCGSTSGGGSPYAPTEEDEAATDWMEYQEPIDLWVDLGD